MKVKPMRFFEAVFYVPVVILWSITRTLARWSENLSGWLVSKHLKMGHWVDEKTEYLEWKYGDD